MQQQLVKSEKVFFDFLPESQDRLTRGITISKGLDRLKFGLYVDFSSERLFDILAFAKREAQEARSEVPLQLTMDSNDFYNCHTSGKKGGYNFRITRADVSVFISTRADWMKTPNVFVDIGSASCWSPGYKNVIHHVTRLITHFDGKIVKNTISEVHICTDFIGLELDTLDIQNKECWIKRANKFNIFYDCNRFSGISLDQTEGNLAYLDEDDNYIETGITLGKGDIMLRVYDKILEIKRNNSKQSLFASVWGKEEYDDEAVTRVEYQLRKTVLKQFRIKSLEDLYSRLDSLWNYCTNDWSRYCSKPFDRRNRHQDRAEIHEFWQAVQNISWDSNTFAFRKKTLPVKNEHMLADQMIGCALNIAAIYRCKPDNIDDITANLQMVVDIYCRKKAKKVNPKTGENELVEKMKQKINEVWPYGYNEVHGHTQNDAEYEFLTQGIDISIFNPATRH